MRRRVSLGIGLAVLICAATDGHAEEDPESLIRQGTELRRKGDNVRAYGYYKRAYDIARTGRTAAQLGLVEQSMQNYLDAETHLSEALASNDPWVEQSRAVLEDSRRKLRSHLGRVEIRGTPPTATAAIGNRATALLPGDRTLWANAGETTIRVLVPGRAEWSKAILVSLGETVVVEVPAAPSAATEPATSARGLSRAPARSPEPGSPPAVVTSLAPSQPPRAKGTSSLGTVGLMTAGAGVLLGATGFIVYRTGVSKLEAIEKAAAKPNDQPYDPSNRNFATLGNIGVAMMIGGGAAIATGAVLYLLRGNHTATTTDTGSLRAGIDSTPGAGLRFHLSGRF